MVTKTETTAGARGAGEADLPVRRITTDDVRQALRQGLDDYRARPTHVIFLCVLYPIVAIVLVHLAFGYSMLPLVFPLISGFALVGPLAATGLYELSRRREMGRDYSWWHVFDVLQAPSRGALALMGVLLAAIFVLWLQIALLIYRLFFGEGDPASVGAFLEQVFTTPEGWGLIVLGCGAGFVFAALVFAISVVSLPMLLDRKVSAAKAVATSIRAVATNAKPMALWAAIVVAALIVGSIPLFFGLAILLPILGHATWHLYRKVVPR